MQWKECDSFQEDQLLFGVEEAFAWKRVYLFLSAAGTNQGSLLVYSHAWHICSSNGCLIFTTKRGKGKKTTSSFSFLLPMLLSLFFQPSSDSRRELKEVARYWIRLRVHLGGYCLPRLAKALQAMIFHIIFHLRTFNWMQGTALKEKGLLHATTLLRPLLQCWSTARQGRGRIPSLSL